MDTIISTSNFENHSSLNCEDTDKESPQGKGQIIGHEEKTGIAELTSDKEFEQSIFRGWESPNAKNATTLEIELAKMHWGFITAMDSYFFVSRDSEKFLQTIRNAGFSHDWTLCDRQVAIARLAIKKKLRMLGQSREWVTAQVQPILNTLIAVYKSAISQQTE